LVLFVVLVDIVAVAVIVTVVWRCRCCIEAHESEGR
jgi:AhpD family alkylhydroperoxidase